MADPNKTRISNKFEKRDNPLDLNLYLTIYFIAASEGYSIGADNLDI